MENETKIVPLTHEERRRLIEEPFSIRTVSQSQGAGEAMRLLGGHTGRVPKRSTSTEVQFRPRGGSSWK